MTIYQKLSDIQQKIEVGKGRENSFDHFMYWNTDDILRAVKPYLEEYHATIVMNDVIESFADKLFVRVEGDFIDLESEKWSAIHFTAASQIEETKGSMRAEQRTGSASSYARKRALSGLLLLDDADDADSIVEPPPKPPRQTKPKAETEKKDTRKPLGTCDFCKKPFYETSEVKRTKDGRVICLKCLEERQK